MYRAAEHTSLFIRGVLRERINHISTWLWQRRRLTPLISQRGADSFTLRNMGGGGKSGNDGEDPNWMRRMLLPVLHKIFCIFACFLNVSQSAKKGN